MSDMLWRVLGSAFAVDTLWQLAPEFRGLVRLEWITGSDGRPAFWKVAHIANTVAFFLVAYWCHAETSLAACLGWLFAWAVLSLYASHAIKGLQLYKQPTVGVTGATATAIAVDAAKLADAALKRRDFDHGIDPA